MNDYTPNATTSATLVTGKRHNCPCGYLTRTVVHHCNRQLGRRRIQVAVERESVRNAHGTKNTADRSSAAVIRKPVA
jgi:sRNA-binding protein